jgi:hypothetical protein
LLTRSSQKAKLLPERALWSSRAITGERDRYRGFERDSIVVNSRSLCTNLAAAERFSPSHLEKPEVAAFISGAKFFYLEGFFLTHGLETFKILAKHAVENNKVCVE